MKKSRVPAWVANLNRRRERTALGTAAFVSLALMTCAAAIAPAPYVVQGPGPTVNVLGDYDGKEVVSVGGSHKEDTDGELRLTTVAVQGSPGHHVQLPTVFASWFDQDRSVAPIEALYPDVNDSEGTRMMNTVQMNSSQDEAIAVALRKQGIEYSKNVIVAGVRTDGPANGILEAGDVVKEVNGTTSDSVQDYVAATGATPKGDKVRITVERGGKELNLEVPTTQQEGRSMMGVVMSEGFDFPVDVTFAVEGIGGPSAGMIFALGIYDDMTPGDLTGGRHIAGTGTIDEAGVVGPIGGIRQKLVGARHDGADFFLAPQDNCAEVVGHIPDGLRVVSVANFDAALAAVEHIAANDSVDGLPTCG